MEHRGLLGALSIAIISLGGATLVAVGTSSYARGKEFNWGSGYANVGEGTLIAGIALLSVTAFLMVRARLYLNRIATVTRSGNDLMQRLGNVNPAPRHPQYLNSERDIIALKGEIEEWIRTTGNWLDEHGPSIAAAHFDNRGVQTRSLWETIPELENDSSTIQSIYSVARARLHMHLHRLSEIATSAMKL